MGGVCLEIFCDHYLEVNVDTSDTNQMGHQYNWHFNRFKDLTVYIENWWGKELATFIVGNMEVIEIRDDDLFETGGINKIVKIQISGMINYESKQLIAYMFAELPAKFGATLDDDKPSLSKITFSGYAVLLERDDIRIKLYKL